MLLEEKNKGKIILLTGISGSGKTTIGLSLKKQLSKERSKTIEFIDGDAVRNFFKQKICFSPEERAFITKQIAFGAYLLAENGIDTIVANIAGSYSIRDFLRSKWKRYIQVFLDADIHDCITNDPKGIYSKYLKHENPNLLGVDIPYEKPRNPDIIVHPYKESVNESVEKIISCLKLQEGK
jgi:adenylylsulfate kinase-like enzyme|tara:strand:+ start:4764 stop:5306 length:543 start_codon:yes stop_codon:yes gene_type:complete